METAKSLSRSFTYFLVLDLEATCDDGFEVPRDEREIIEIGACVVDAELKVVGEFQTFVRPVRHPRLTDFCRELTHISQADVDAAPGYREAVGAFRAWWGQYKRLTLWGSWANYDRNQFERDAKYHGCSAAEVLPRRHVNLKEAYRRTFGLPVRPGVRAALAHAGLAFEGTPHRALYDAKNIVRLLPQLMGPTGKGR